MQVHRADTAADMRRHRPTEGEVVDQVGHERIGVAVPGRIEVCAPDRDATYPVLPKAKFLLKPPRPPLVAGTGANVEAVLEMLGSLDPGAAALGVAQHGPAALAAEIPGTRHARLIPRK